uniref:Uncharacterized protein n=1 Tax=Rhizophora mucronata TaxID=61149 RepID=A0A2P2P3I0_RHIMU
MRFNLRRACSWSVTCDLVYESILSRNHSINTLSY